MLIIFLKSQLGLFTTIPVHVEGSVRKDGTRVKPHMSKRRVKLEPHQVARPAAAQAAHGAQGALFGEPAAAAPRQRRATKLEAWLARHGGPARMADTLAGMTAEQRGKLIDAMAHLGGVSHGEVEGMLGAGVPQAAATTAAAEPDLFNQPAEPAKEPNDLPKTAELAGEAQEARGEEGAQGSEEAASGGGAGGAGAADVGPKEGDKNAEGLVFHDGRWHREETAAQAAPAAPPLVTYTTAKGKELRGIVRSDLTKEQAQAIDPYTFRHQGGWFIREKHLGAAPAAPATGAAAPAPAAEPAAATPPEPTPTPTPKADKLRAAGQALVDKATAEGSRDRNTNTARRARMAAGAEAEAAKQAAIGRTMVNIADAIDAGSAHHLNGVTTRAAVETLDRALMQAMRENDRKAGSYAEQERRKGRPPEPDDIRVAKLPSPSWTGAGANQALALELLKGKRGAKALADQIRNSHWIDAEQVAGLKKHLTSGDVTRILGWYNEEQVANVARLARIGIKSDSDLRLALTEYVMHRDGPKAADPVKAAERALVGRKVGVDFFPTPKPLAARMAEMAGIKPGMKVLEPSAGSGHLADAARAAGGDVDAVEVSSELRNLLEAKGHKLVGHDFMDVEHGDQQYDAILMNPPFGNRADSTHIQHAYGHLKPGGKLVAIAGEGVFIGSDRKAVEFREWLDAQGAEVEKLPENTFKGADLPAQTGANARLVVIEKPAAAETGPQEGERNADGLVFRDGRWHRDEEPAAEAPATAPAPDPTSLAEDREDLADEMMRDPHSEKARDLVRKVAEGERRASEPDPLTMTPKQYHDAKLKNIALKYKKNLSFVREMYDTDAGRKENEQEWVNGIMAAAKAGKPLTRATLDKLHEVRPGAVGQLAHDYPEAKIPEGYQVPDARKAEAEEQSARVANRKAIKEESKARRQEPAPEAVSVTPTVPPPTGVRYALQDRAATIGSVPDGYTKIEPVDPTSPHAAFARHGFITYPQKLDDGTARRMGLVHAMNEQEADELAGSVAGEMADYAKSYLRQPEAKFKESVAQFIPAGVSVGDKDKFVAAVHAKLAASQAPTAPREGDRNADGLVFRDGRWHREAEPAAPAPAATPSDLDPTSPTYRYRDTGHIAGSRKEQAAEQIRAAGRTGTRLRATDVDWGEIESNPREAAELITKSNLFGSVDWASLRENGMQPGAGFLVDRVYASVGTEPALNTPQARRDYALGLESLRDRMERCQTPEQVTKVLEEIRDEIQGVMLNASESEEYAKAVEEARAAKAVAQQAEAAKNVVFQEWQTAMNELNTAEWEQRKRADRKWKPDPKLDARVAELKTLHDRTNEAYTEYMRQHPELETKKRDMGNGYVSYANDLEYTARQAWQRATAVKERAKARNLLENPMTRAWATLGEKFLRVVHWRSGKGSEAFQGHVTTAKNGKIADWSWAEKETKRAPTSTKREVGFQLAVAEKFERKGGRAVTADSTAALKKAFGLREVQSGNWVLNDPNSAAFHVQHAAEAFADLADLLGVPDEHVSMNGRLAMAFGARGRGNAGWKGAARAHYDATFRVINLTKMGGGGALGHEFFHCLDNLIKEAEGAGESGAEDYVTENPALLPAGPLRDAVQGLRDAMLSGKHQATVTIPFTAADVENARYNIDRQFSVGVGAKIKQASGAEAAVKAVQDHFDGRYGDSMPKKIQRQRDRWVTLAAAYHGGAEDGGEVKVKSGKTMSSFALEAQKLDQGEEGKYWSQGKEMAARAFQSWIEDRLADRGQKSDYLSVYADNKYHVDPFFGPQYPYPEGEERQRINAAFDRLVGVLRDRGTLAKAMALVA